MQQTAGELEHEAHLLPSRCLQVCYLSLKAKVKIWATAGVAAPYVGLYIYTHTHTQVVPALAYFD